MPIGGNLLIFTLAKISLFTVYSKIKLFSSLVSCSSIHVIRTLGSLLPLNTQGITFKQCFVTCGNMIHVDSGLCFVSEH